MNLAESVRAYNRLVELHHPSAQEWVPHADHDEFKIITIDRCALAFGALPISAFSKLTKIVPKKSVMGPYAAQLAGANLAAGMPEDLKALAERLKPEALRRTRVQFRNYDLPDTAITWLAIGERGMSSDAMFYRLTDIVPPGGAARDAARHPLDAADLGRCRQLLEQVPELTSQLSKMAAVSPIWQRLVDRWDELTALMDQECPLWRDHVGTAKQTCALMDAIISEPSADSAPPTL